MDIEKLIEYIKSTTDKDSLNKETSKNCLPILKDNLLCLKKRLTRPVLSKFLYYNCHLFNRFSIPTARYHVKEEQVIYEEYLNIFEIIENGFIDNLLTLQIDKLIWQLLNEIELKENIEFQKYYNKLEIIDSLKHSLSEKKREEYFDHYDKLINLITGCKTNTILTTITCLLPVSPILKKTIINTKFDSTVIEIILTPNFSNTVGSIRTNSDAAIVQNTNSSWQYSTCNVVIEICGYLDLLKGYKKLYAEYDVQDTFNPWIFTFTYEILCNISWQLRKKNKDFITNWLVFPNDIEAVTYELKANNQNIQWIHYPTKTGFKIQKMNNSSDNININLDDEVLWHEKCLILAEDYLSLGEARLSIFWLNIGIESFFEYRVDEICNESNIEKKIIFNENYYDRTKEELKKINSSEIFDKIIWPTEKSIHLSLYKKIKNLFNNNILNSELKKDTFSKYRNISKYRNDVFHGVNNESIEIDVVLKAIESYKWLLETLRPRRK